MADGRGAFEWKQTSLLAALVYNPHRGKGSKSRKPSDFDPYAERPRRGVDFLALKRAFNAGAFGKPKSNGAKPKDPNP